MRKAGVGPKCAWEDPDDPINNVEVALAVRGGGGLSGVYSAHARGETAFFEPTEISGYPAVYSDPEDLRGKGTCSVIVGIRDELAVDIIASFQTTSPHYPEPCLAAGRAAEVVVATLKAGA
ncbi:DUF3558 family protein [Amycolatopsis sp. NPDC004378]